ncbi:MAG: undecaprenyl-diphosphate phosphatase [Planctomycetota bacterium]|nr:undecaprenyl-diphosphate phosphatase [Planctomycetota bacterium]
MNPFEAIVLGIVEGITEFLPVSSTGHLILAQRALGIPNDVASRSFAICIQGGAILAVLSLYWPRVVSLLRGLVGRDASGLRLLGLLIVAFVPAAVVGLAFEDEIDAVLFGLKPVVVAWFVGGVVILAVPLLRRGRSEGIEVDSMNVRHALVIGLFQCLALAPGTSRSLATIVGALVVGLAGRAAVEFSLLLGVMTLGAATAHKALKSGDVLVAHYGATYLALGFVTSFISAFFAVKWLVAWLNRRGLAVFGGYRIALAIVVAVLIWKNVLPAA